MIRVLLLADTHLGFDLPSKPRVERRRRGPDFFPILVLHSNRRYAAKWISWSTVEICFFGASCPPEPLAIDAPAPPGDPI